MVYVRSDKSRAMSLAACLALATMGCSSAPDHAFPLRNWSAELPGRAEPLEITLPTHLDTMLPHGPAEYVLRTRVQVPEAMRGRPLTLAIAHMPAMATLRVDGAQAVPIDASPFDSYRASGPQRWRIPEDASSDGRLDLELRVKHRFVRSAWIDSVPELTPHPLGGAHLAGVYTFNTVAAIGALAASLIVGFFYAILFLSLRDKKRAAYGWFALGALCGMPYPAFVLGLTQPVFGVYEGPFLTLALALGSIAAMAFARAYVGAPPPSRSWTYVLVAALAASVLARDPFVSVLVMGPVVVAVTAATTFAQGAFVLRLRRQEKKPPKTIYAIAFAWPATVLLGLPDILAWLGQGEPSGGVRTACLGIMGCSLYQAAALSRDHLLSLKRADHLVAELGERVKLLQAKHAEVELLNDELRRQIAARSRELAEKLLKMDTEELTEPPALDAGMVVENRYRVVKQLGEGGMGTVYEVERITDGKHFALKALAGGFDAQARARFAREAQIVANVNHPNVVSIVDVDVAKSGFIFLVMELIAAGTTLHDIRRRHYDVPWTLNVLAQVAEGIDAIHAAGIIHRDLKPGNILLSRGADGRRPLVKITDFGISTLTPDGTRMSVVERAAMLASSGSSLPDPGELLDPFAAVLEDTSSSKETDELATRVADAPIPESDRSREPRTPSKPLTETGIIFGTPQYMAQELTSGTKNATRASDVFSLAIIAFEVLTGKRPFREAPVKAKLNGHALPVQVPFKTMCPTLPLDVATLLDRAMAHDPRTRPTAKELAIALREAADKLTP